MRARPTKRHAVTSTADAPRRPRKKTATEPKTKELGSHVVEFLHAYDFVAARIVRLLGTHALGAFSATTRCQRYGSPILVNIHAVCSQRSHWRANLHGWHASVGGGARDARGRATQAIVDARHAVLQRESSRFRGEKPRFAQRQSAVRIQALGAL